MISDNSDKTVFRQLSIDSDCTVIRSNPVGRSSTTMGQHISKPQLDSRVIQYTESDIQPRASRDEAYEFRALNGLNPLLNVSSTLIAVFDKTRNALNHKNIGGLHQDLVNEIKTFEKNSKSLGFNSETVLLASYVLCAALDEAVLNTPWGSESKWNQRTLLSIFHKESSGGEKFFLILNRKCEMPAANIDFLEFMYVLLSLGFSGKYRIIHGGRDTLDHIRDELFITIRSQRGEFERSLSPNWQGIGSTGLTLKRYMPLRIIASVVLAVLIVSYSGFRLWMQQSSSPLEQQLHAISESKPSSLLNIPTFKTTD